MQAHEMNRKMFLRLTLTGVATTALGACGSEEPSNTMGPVGPTGGTTTGGGSVNNTAMGNTVTAGNTTGFGTTSSTTGAGTTSSTTGAGTTSSTTGAGTTSSTTGFGTTSSTTGAGTTSSTTGFGTTSSTTGVGGQGTMTGGGTGMGTGTGMGGSGGGMNNGACTAQMLDLMQTSNEMHSHLPLAMGEAMELAMLVNDGGGGMLTFAGPDDHTHTLTFDAQEVMTLASGGELTGKQSSEDGFHTHTYTISCG